MGSVPRNRIREASWKMLVALPARLIFRVICSESSGIQDLLFWAGGRYVPVLEEGHLRQDSSTISALVRSPPGSSGGSSSSSSSCGAAGAPGASGSGPSSSSTELSEGYWYVVSRAVSLKEILSCGREGPGGSAAHGGAGLLLGAPRLCPRHPLRDPAFLWMPALPSQIPPLQSQLQKHETLA